jgi:peptidyl-prolyl cis-trans isomerase C
MKEKALSIMTATIFFIFFYASVLSSEEQEKEKAVAEVNGVIILQQDLDIAMNRFLPKDSFHAGVSPERVKQAKKMALEELINSELFYQEAIRIGLIAEPEEVEKRLTLIERRYPSARDFKDALDRYGISIEVLKKRIERNLLIEKLMEKELKVVLTDEMLKEYYEKNSQKFREPEKVSLRYIWIKFRPSESDFRKKARKRAQEALSKLKAGRDFAEVAQLYSDDRSRIRGGDVGYIHKGILPGEIEKVAFSLRPGEISGLIENDYGYHIIKLEDKRPSRQIPFSEIKEKLRSELTSSRQKEKRQRLIKRLREKATITYY